MPSPNNSKKGTPKRPSAIQDDFASGTTWSLSFRLLDPFRNWSFPDRAEAKWNIFGWLIKLNQDYDLRELKNIALSNSEGTAHHWVGFDKLNSDALGRVKYLQSRPEYFEIIEDRLFSMRYCYRPNSPERLIGTVFNHVYYPIWWDANHEVYGATRKANTAGICESYSCIHPWN